LALPYDLKYRASGIVKPKFTPLDIPGYRNPLWTTRLFGNLYSAGGHFADDLTELNALSALLEQSIAARTSLETAKTHEDVPVVNRLALDFLGVARPVYVNNLVGGQYQKAKITVDARIGKFQAALGTRSTSFYAKYEITFNGKPLPPDLDPLPLFTPADPDVCPVW
jgi:hypothetical protein